MRLNIIQKEIDACKIFADVGCDHGKISKYVLDNGLCDKAYISDVSATCLKKAEILLSDYIAKGKCISFVSNGLREVPPADFVLIAGMGGKEIIEILSCDLDKIESSTLLLQPMKNSMEVREFLLLHGFTILLDYTFRDKLFYDIIKAKKLPKMDFYTEDEKEFGRDNLTRKDKDFMAKIKREFDRNEKVLKTCKLQDKSKTELCLRQEKLKGILL